MRGYFFVNMYLSSIQKGIQTAHCITKIAHENKQNNYVMEYPEHMTKIVLDGGNHKMLLELHAAIADLGKQFQEKYPGEKWYPFAAFHEDEQSLNGACTCVGIILPERIYEFADNVRHNVYKIEEHADGALSVVHGWAAPVGNSAVLATGQFAPIAVDLESIGLTEFDVKLAKLIMHARLAV